MQVKFQTIVQQQNSNPFLRMTKSTHDRLLLALRARLLFLAQLGSSQRIDDQQIYSALATTADRRLFGRSPRYDNRANTGLAVLAGAVEKMYHGDLSLKQLKYIMPVLTILHEYYPDEFDAITFHEVTDDQQSSQFTELFDDNSIS